MSQTDDLRRALQGRDSERERLAGAERAARQLADEANRWVAVYDQTADEVGRALSNGEAWFRAHGWVWLLHLSSALGQAGGVFTHPSLSKDRP